MKKVKKEKEVTKESPSNSSGNGNKVYVRSKSANERIHPRGSKKKSQKYFRRSEIDRSLAKLEIKVSLLCRQVRRISFTRNRELEQSRTHGAH